MRKLKLHQELPTKWTERENLRDKGQFWTPAWVADAMVSYVCENNNLLFDPATGRGAFFEALLRLRQDISFYGTDVDPEVLADPIYHRKNCKVERKDFLKDPPSLKFMSIVGNPPYIRHHRIDKETKAIIKELCLSITGNALDGRAGYHIYFLIQALHHLEPDGKLAFIMPADTCEGKFAPALWDWISATFCIEAVITFSEDATPFPDVDTNAMVFLIRNGKPRKDFYWVRSKQAYSNDLSIFIGSAFKQKKLTTLEVTQRTIKEGVSTGLSRPKQDIDHCRYQLKDFATVVRGIATGSNEFFFLTAARVKELRLSKKLLQRAIGRTRDATKDLLTSDDMVALETAGRPTYLLSIKAQDKLPAAIINYLKVGEDMELPARALISQRKPWYKMEQRKIPPLLFSYLGRRYTRFIKNDAGVVPLTGFLCVYPFASEEKNIINLWKALNHPDTIGNLHLVGKSYGSGAIKVEPGNLGKLPIPGHVVELFRLIKGS